LVALCDQVTDHGWPEEKFWLPSPRHFINAMKRELELLLLEEGTASSDHLARLGLFAVMALHSRAQGRSEK
jgi:hypothetical protein